MNAGHNMQEIILANLIGITMMVCVLTRKAWKIYSKTESKYLLFLVNSVLFACILEPITFRVDGDPRLPFRIINYVTVSVLFMSTLAMGSLWLLLVVRRIYNRKSKVISGIINAVGGVGAVTMIINFFYPILFSVGKDGFYKRGPLYAAYILLAFGQVILASIFFLLGLYRGGRFKYFPAIQFMIPVGIGTFVQYHNYGISTMYPSMAVGLTLMIFSLQSENLYTDKLLGVYNRFYLDRIWNKMKKSGPFCLMFADINNFKHINDEYGHAEGDKVLKTVSVILKQAVGNRGTVIRFAGDEFTMLINTKHEDTAKKIRQDIIDHMSEYNRTGIEPYEITVSLGHHITDPANEDMFEAMKAADQDMYKDKQKYYETHERRRS